MSQDEKKNSGLKDDALVNDNIDPVVVSEEDESINTHFFISL
jgi:hypothetical protein